MKHLGDITEISGYDVPIVDIVTGGSPCQDLSVAGKREGLKGERSGLFMEQIRIIKEMREHDGKFQTDGTIRPRYMVWENVPGAFSSNKGYDFKAVLEETAKIADENAVIPEPTKDKNGKLKWSTSGVIVGDGWSIAWRVHDAQFWGVPQRRKRISLVADFGGETAPEILFERKGVSRDTEESGKEGQGAATDVERGVGASSYTLKIRGGVERDSGGKKAGKGPLVQTELSATLGAVQDQTLITNKVYNIGSYDSNAMKSDNPHSGIYEADTSRTLDNNGGNPACNQGGMAVVQGADVYNGQLTGEVAATLTEACGGTNTSGAKVVCLEGNGSRPSHKGNGYAETDTMYTLNSTEKHPADSRVKISDDNIVQTLSGRMGTGGGNVPMVMAVESHAQDSRYKVGDVNQPLSANMEHDPANGGLVMGEAYCVGNGQLSQARISDKVGALNCMHDQQAVITMTPKTDDEGVAFSLRGRDYKDPQCVTYGLDRASYNQGINAKYDFSVEAEKIATQTAKGPGAVYNNYIVRRLTPLECERLQGFPDDWTNIGEWVDSKGKKHKDADSPRYKALGNSIALPFWQYLADKMCAYLEDPTMASLFDGIGGFPLVFTRAGAKPIWASEIEEFPIAVTKRRFSDEVRDDD